MVAHALKIHCDRRFISAPPPHVMARRKQGCVSRFTLKLTVVIHHDMERTGNRILEMRRPAAFHFDDRLKRFPLYTRQRAQIN
jgi:hypothetical protein